MRQPEQPGLTLSSGKAKLFLLKIGIPFTISVMSHLDPETADQKSAGARRNEREEFNILTPEEGQTKIPGAQRP